MSLIRFKDSQLVVAEKPPGISTVPYDDRERGTLLELLTRELGGREPEVVHRIDKDTSGLVVFARRREAARALSQQLRFHSMERIYLALVQGKPPLEKSWESVLIENRGDGLRGTAPLYFRVARGEGKTAVTHVRRLAHARGVSLVACRLETGRTHQIRIHLSESGTRLVGERLYLRTPDGLEYPRSDELKDEGPRALLHAAVLGFRHPLEGEPMRFVSAPPEDFLLKCQEAGLSLPPPEDWLF